MRDALKIICKIEICFFDAEKKHRVITILASSYMSEVIRTKATNKIDV